MIKFIEQFVKMGALFSLCFDTDPGPSSTRERLPLISIQEQARELRELRTFITDDRRKMETLENIILKTQNNISNYRKDGNSKDFDINNRILYLEKRFDALSDALGGCTNTKSVIE